ncbi:bifunctional [glutamate--ammonia ligase]-adenylyl-L-tyrosine phosphorylase/[glutamate--ammonia-ligase] adenylyltransferase [Thermosulfuriphilus ammonigenes]|uniref:Bifunctional [glutamate--ammonia ligase]-adenylyl-L-tyrosine phosphorylase/[glutamate--ammonia-ligase] adenylyltransferase n=1 Tax=Thermosulfuriphilus ammonigenes TaxID=1936021 RepID=A0A6G7PVH3_9BACT|nr:bifunctional [glutamate--ammonia ligase]-adenylyl-L-tyrosine phosphorylase/[glutamate--ammonia-ligase] adenylyltransferase [Thermosulfuriphilus ammonigenes]MBA2848140.1 glutamate-ammonia-ligase adenylyltransferase [Thermosulfuriphilus ammonigenes]QIJ71684.1 bifunctional [glutamate--ammonia ligase]-adenylyl-L-tyrosine phosphorylase/[glutamate--ammonia-ligase] adenylyltransferase [Thermosulfuriphilus ammonigenes]
MEKIIRLARDKAPDPETALRGWERLTEAHSDLPWSQLTEENLTRLVRLLGASIYLTNALVNDRGILQEVFFEGRLFLPSRLSLWRELSGAIAGDRRIFLRRLREVKKKAFVRLATIDLKGRLSFVRILRSITAIYEMLIRAALSFAAKEQGLPAEALIVLGMGKLGARELNYSSDVDLIFLSPNRYPRTRVIRLAESLIQLLSSYVEGDIAARVDMRLRPGGKDGELVHSLPAAVTYYRFQAQAWEHLALIKARGLAGDLKGGLHFLAGVEPIVFRRYLDYAYLEEIARLKEKISRETAQKKLARDIKLGPGGIREIEFFVQALQLIFGGRLPKIRKRDTLGGLRRLAEAGLISEAALRELSAAYIFLRNLEHRLQMIHFTQTHRLPGQPAASRALARSLGLKDEEELEDRLQRIRRQVEEHFGALFRPTSRKSTSSQLKEALELALEGAPLKETAASLGLASEEPLASLVAKFRGKSRLVQKRREILWPVLPDLIQMALKTPRPGVALNNLEAFITRAGGRTSLLYLLKDRPDVAERLIYALGTSPFLADLLLKGPILSEALVLRVHQTGAGQRPLVLEQIDREDYGQAVASLRRFKNEEVLVTGFGDLFGEVKTVGERLTRIAETVVRGAFLLSRRELKRRSGQPSQTLAILALGKLGSRELSYRSDLDVIFLYRGDQEEMIRATKLAQNIISVLTMPLEEGPGYEVDVRLRPGGSKGPLVSEIGAFLDYHRRESDLWEKQVLLRLAPLVGEATVVEEALAGVAEILGSLRVGPKEAQQLREMRARIEKERGREENGRLNPKLGYGGLADVEFIVQWHQLSHLPRYPQLLVPNPLKALHLLAQYDLIPQTEVQTLSHNYRFLTRLDRRLILFYDRRTEERVYTAEEIKEAEVVLGPHSLEEYLRIREVNRHLFERLIPH